MDKGTVLLDLPGFIVLILCHEALKRQLAVVIVVEKIFLDICPLLKESSYRNPGRVGRAGRYVSAIILRAGSVSSAACLWTRAAIRRP